MSHHPALKYQHITHRGPKDRDPEERIYDYGGIETLYDPAIIIEQSSVCGDCGSPTCTIGHSTSLTGCPIGNDIPDVHLKASQGDLKGAYEIANKTNSWGLFTGYACPSINLCQSTCVLKDIGSVSIRQIERDVHLQAWQSDWVQPLKPLMPKLGKSVGIVGSGPAGGYASEKLVQFGLDAEVYERDEVAGGLLRLGIPDFKIPFEAVDLKYQWLQKGGVVFNTKVNIGVDISFENLAEKHDVVLITAGKTVPRDPGISGDGAHRVIHAIDFLKYQNRVNQGLPVSDEQKVKYNLAGKNIVVIGGGDTGNDANRTVVRQTAQAAKMVEEAGAGKVTCLYRRDRMSMPGSQKETQAALDEGVRYQFMTQPEKVTIDHRNGKLIVSGPTTMQGPPDGSGRQNVVVDYDSNFEITDVDVVISATGFTMERLPTLFNVHGMPMNKDGTLSITNNIFKDDPKTRHMPRMPVMIHNSFLPVAGLVGVYTTASGKKTPVFGAGDSAGSSLIVEALRGGRDIAPHIYMAAFDQEKYLNSLTGHIAQMSQG